MYLYDCAMGLDKTHSLTLHAEGTLHIHALGHSQAVWGCCAAAHAAAGWTAPPRAGCRSPPIARAVASWLLQLPATVVIQLKQFSIGAADARPQAAANVRKQGGTGGQQRSGRALWR